MLQPYFQVGAAEERGEFAIAMAEVENGRDRVVLLSLRDKKVDQEAFATSCSAQDQRVPNVLDVEVECVGYMVRRFEDGKRFAA